MLRCRIPSSPAWKVGKSSLQYIKQASFSNLPSNLSPSLRDGLSHSDGQSIPDPNILVTPDVTLSSSDDLSAGRQLSPKLSNGTYTSISGAEAQLGGSKLVEGTDKATYTSKGARDKGEAPLSSKAADNLMQKLVELRTASRDILAVAKSAIKLAAKDSQQGISTPVNTRQDGTTDWSLEGMNGSRSLATDSLVQSRPRIRTLSRRRTLNAFGGIRNADGSVVARRIVSESSNKVVRRTSSTRKQQQHRSIVQDATSTKTTPREVTVSPKKPQKSSAKDVKTSLLSARQLKLDALDAPKQPPVKTLSYDLDRVLFKQGVYNLQDPRTGVFNFDHYLQNIMPAEEFDFDSLARFMTSSEDNTLQDLAKEKGKRYVGSTSSMTSVLSHFHFLLSSFRPLTLGRISRAYPKPLSTFTEFTRIPASIYLKYRDGVYAVDSDKEFDRATILSQLGQSLEKLLTVPKDMYEQYRKTSSEKISEETKNTPEAYHYSSLGNFVFRSQLDGRHDWLPGAGIFDIKTRACVTIRMDQDNYKDMSGYQIRDLYGEWESYEREYLDMLRSTMLKYSLQVRMGRMDGIFVAYHNTEQIFGFQYVPLSEMDLAIHGQENLALGDQEFNFSMQMFSDVLDLVTEQFPRQSIRFHFETRPRSNSPPEMYIFAELMDTETMDTVRQAETEMAIQELRNEMLGEERPVHGDSNNKELSMQPEDQNGQDHAEGIDTSRESGTELSSEGAQDSEPSAKAVDLQEVEPNIPSNELSSGEETEAAVSAETQPAKVNTDSANLDKHNVKPPSETISNEEPVLFASEDTEQKRSAIHSMNKDEDLSSTADGAEHPPQTEPVLHETKSNQSQGGRRPILGFSLTTSHYIDGKVVAAVPSIKYSSEWPIQQSQYRKGKPVNAPSADKVWNVSYKVRQFGDVDARRLYQACQARKRKKFEQLDQRDDYRDRYVRMMKTWSERGRSHKNKAEKAFSKDIKQVAP